MSNTNFAVVAERLGIPVREVDDVLESPAGLVIKTTDGNTYIDVPEDRPDGAGKTGLMFLAAPSPNYGKGDASAFPVYVMSEDGELMAAPEPEENPDEVPDGSGALVLEWVAGDHERAARALEAENARAKGPRTGLVKELDAILAQWVAAAPPSSELGDPGDNGDNGGRNGDGLA